MSTIRLPSVSVIVPTYKEAENLPLLLDRLDRVRCERGLDMEVLIVDDDSRDGTVEALARYERFRPKLIVRTADRGLSQSVCEGLARAANEVLVVMDADLSHPPESIPQLLEAIARGGDFAIGSRYVKGGSTSEDWGLLRWINSRAATLLARPFTAARDPMSGFFALRRDDYRRAAERLNPIGYKIGLELIVKCGCRSIREVPIHFDNRRFGKSKLSLREQLRYLQHLRRLAIYTYGTWSHLAQFLVVGGLGAVVNLAALTLLLLAGVGVNAALAAAIVLSMVFNFALNRRFTFSYARRGPMLQQLAGFVAACSLGALVNYTLAAALLRAFPALMPQLASMAGIVAGSGLNFLFNRFAVFRRRPRYPRPN
ncbi:MAG TPA: glycosyltransferase family 2 protein [Burkholderiales bacterium]